MSVLEKTAAREKALAPSPYDKAWDKCIKDLEGGVSVYVAIQNVYDLLPPPATPTMVAPIVGYVYGDTFWNNVQMDASLLSAALQKAMGWGKTDCDRAAKAAYSSWRGILMRKNFNDVGNIPLPNGQYTESPDAICNLDAPLTVSRLLDNWNSMFWNFGVVGKNYCYTRGASLNFPRPIKEAKVRMYHSEAGFNAPPTSWVMLATETGDSWLPLQGKEEGPIDPGERGAAGAFIFQPSTVDKHYCLIGVTQTEFFSNDPSTIPLGNWNSYTWIAWNGAAAWHNIDVQTQATHALRYHNQDGRPERFAFEAHAINVPQGTHIALSADDRELAAPIVSQGRRTFRKHELIQAEGVVPAHFSGDLAVTVEPPGGKLLPAGAAVHVRMLWLLEHGHAHYADAAALPENAEAAAQGRELRVPLGNYTLTGR